MIALIHACGLAHGISPSVELARDLIAQGAEVNARTERGFTALTEACAYGALELVELLLDAGADPNLHGERAGPPLMFAATRSHRPEAALRIVQLLLDKGADVNAQDEYGYTTLLKLISGKRFQLDVARLLIEAGVDLDHVGPGETTALRSAAEKGYLELVRLLVDKGANASWKRNGKSALSSAMRGDHADVVVHLLEAGAEAGEGGELLAYAGAHGHADLLRFVDLASLSHEETGEALVQAASSGQLGFVQSLVQRGIDPTMDHEGREDPLMKAARHGHLDVAAYLLEHHASLEARDERGNTPLLFAAHEGRLEMLSFLLERGADLHARNGSGWTALFQACAKGHDRCINHLIRRGADVDAIDEEHGATPLIIAASRGRRSAVALLLDAGAKTEIHAKNGRTALTWARGNDSPEIVEVLRRAGATVPVLPSTAGLRASSRCACCDILLSAEESRANACAPCNACYCDTHYPWSEWQSEHVTSDDMVRSAMCPQGHPRQEHGGPRQ